MFIKQEKISYVSTKTKGEELFFSVEYETIKNDIDPNISIYSSLLDIHISLSYDTHYIKEHNYVQGCSEHNFFKFSFSGNTFTVDDIVLSYKSYGVGTAIMQKVLQILRMEFPQARVSFKMSAEDEAQRKGEEWEERRNKFYEKFGFNKSADGRTYSISNVSDLNIDFVLPHVEVVSSKYFMKDIAGYIERITLLEGKYKSAESALEYRNQDIKKKNSLIRNLVIVIFVGILIIYTLAR